jgi:hypothetical protein
MRVSIPSWELDLPLCVQSGQVFRWRQEGEQWLGYADAHLLIVQPLATAGVSNRRLPSDPPSCFSTYSEWRPT